MKTGLTSDQLRRLHYYERLGEVAGIYVGDTFTISALHKAVAEAMPGRKPNPDLPVQVQHFLGALAAYDDFAARPSSEDEPPTKDLRAILMGALSRVANGFPLDQPGQVSVGDVRGADVSILEDGDFGPATLAYVQAALLGGE